MCTVASQYMNSNLHNSILVGTGFISENQSVYQQGKQLAW